MTTWGLFTTDGAYSARCFSKGLQNKGFDFTYNNPMGWNDSFFREVDVAVVFGWRKDQQACLKSFTSRNIPTVVVDLGYVNRFEDGVDNISKSYLQVGIGDRLNSIPPFYLPADRFDKLGLRYPDKFNDPDGYLLFCGQWVLDASHPFNDELSIKSFIDELQEKVGDVKIKYRQHPRMITNDVERRAIEEDFNEARAVITWSSNSGHDALREGIPVFASEDAAYYEIATDIKFLNKKATNPPFPNEKKWRQYFSRLAYGQWSFEEIESGEAIDFLWNRIDGHGEKFWRR